MKKSIVELMDEFMKTATPESFLRDCKEFGIELEDVAPPIDKSSKKTKGERLGWKSISEYKAMPLKEIIGNGSVVNETYSYQDTSVRLIP